MYKNLKRGLQFKLCTDGGSYNNGHCFSYSFPVICSCGIVIEYNNEIIYQRGFIPPNKKYEGSNIYAELFACIYGFYILNKIVNHRYYKEAKYNNIIVDYRTDSEYIVKGYNQYIYNWIKKDWKNSANKEVPYQPLWKYLIKNFKENPKYIMKFTHVRGHTTATDNFSMLNKLCDRLASYQIKKEKERLNISGKYFKRK